MKANLDSGMRGIFAFEIWNPGLWNPECSLRNPESTTGIRNPSSKDKNLEPSDWNPESKIVSDSLTCGDLSVLPTTLASNKNTSLICECVQPKIPIDILYGLPDLQSNRVLSLLVYVKTISQDPVENRNRNVSLVLKVCEARVSKKKGRYC